MSDTQTNETATETNTETEGMKLDDVAKRYFGPDKLDDANAYIEQIMAVPEVANESIKVLSNFDAEDMPEGYGVWVLPIAKREDGANKTIGIVFGMAPSLDALSDHDKGLEAVSNLVAEAFADKIANSVRPRGDENAISGTMPTSIEDFIENRKTRGSLQTFTKIAPDFVKILRKKKLKTLTAAQLRQILQSSAFAEHLYPSIEQDTWEKIIDHMIARAKADDLDPGILEEWKATRDEAEVTEVSDLDLSDLGDLLGEDDAGEDGSGEEEEEKETQS